MLLDTSGLMCCHDRSDSRHALAKELYGSASVVLIHNYVLAEFVALCRARRVPIGPALVFLREVANDPRTEVVWVDADLHDLGLTLLESRIDKEYSLCDAISFVLMQRRGVHSCLSTDHHFEQEGFLRLLVPSAT